jgi:hypothetical protein
MPEPKHFLSDETVHQSPAGLKAENAVLHHGSAGFLGAIASPFPFGGFPHVGNIGAASTGNNHA